MDGKALQVEILDTAGQDEYTVLRETYVLLTFVKPFYILYYLFCVDIWLQLHITAIIYMYIVFFVQIFAHWRWISVSLQYHG